MHPVTTLRDALAVVDDIQVHAHGAECGRCGGQCSTVFGPVLAEWLLEHAVTCPGATVATPPAEPDPIVDDWREQPDVTCIHCGVAVVLGYDGARDTTPRHYYGARDLRNGATACA